MADRSRDLLRSGPGLAAPSQPYPRALLAGVLALGAGATASLQSCDPSDPAPTSGNPATLDPSAWPAIEAERVATTELTFNPRFGADPGAEVVISADGDVFAAPRFPHVGGRL